MTMYYLRLHHEARTDAKLESLPDDQFRVWFRLLCYASEQEDRGMICHAPSRLLAVEVAHGDQELLARTIESLVELRILEQTEDADGDPELRFRNWEKRQYDKPSDTPEATRARKQAQRARDNGHAPPPVTSMSRDVTPRHAQSRVELEQSRVEQSKADADADLRSLTNAPDDGSGSGAYELIDRVLAIGGLDPRQGDLLTACLAVYQDRDPARIVAEAAKAAAWAKERRKHFDVKLLDNWLARTFREADAHTERRARASPNGKRPPHDQHQPTDNEDWLNRVTEASRALERQGVRVARG